MKKKVVWLVRGFKDYRVPLYNMLAEMEDIEFFIIFNSEITDESIYSKLNFNKSHQIRLQSEFTIGPKDNNNKFGNKSFRIPFQKGILNNLKTIDPDIIIGEGFFQWTFYAYLFKIWKNKVRIIVSYERTKHTERNAQYIRTLYRKLALKFTRAIVCNGILSKSYIEDLGFKGKIITGNMSVDVFKINDIVKQKNTPISNTGQIHYLYLGLLTERKGILELLEIWEKYEAKHGHKIKLSIVGDGNLKQKITDIINRKKIKTVTLVGSLNYEEVIEFFKEVDILINPTLEDNWSLVVPEAMAAELPIITTIYNGLYPELIRQNNGWIIDILNGRQTLETLEYVIAKKEFLKLMGKESFEIIKEYTPNIIAENYKNAFT